MKRVIVFLALFFVTAISQANDNDYLRVEKLTDTQKAELAVTAARLAEQNKTPPVHAAVVDEVDKWVNIGSNIGKGLAGTAKELGIAANEFVQTPVGKVTAGLIVWKVIGHDIVSLAVHVGGGITFFVIMFSFWIWFHRKYCYPCDIETWTGEDKVTHTRKTLNMSDYDERIWGSILLLGVITALSLITIFTY